MEDIIKIEEAVARVGKDRIRQAMESDNADALKDLFDEEGMSLTDEQLDSIAGGIFTPHEAKIAMRKLKQSNGSVLAGGFAYFDADDPNDPNWTGPPDTDTTATD